MGCGASKTEVVVAAHPSKPLDDTKVDTGKAVSPEDVSDQEKAALTIQQRARGMADRKKVQEQKAKGELPGQVREKELSEKEQAALKIQQRARGMADRKKVEEQKKAGNLPGQARQQSEGQNGVMPEATDKPVVDEGFTPGAAGVLMPEAPQDGLEPLGQDAMSGALASPRPSKPADE